MTRSSYGCNFILALVACSVRAAPILQPQEWLSPFAPRPQRQVQARRPLVRAEKLLQGSLPLNKEQPQQVTAERPQQRFNGIWEDQRSKQIETYKTYWIDLDKDPPLAMYIEEKKGVEWKLTHRPQAKPMSLEMKSEKDIYQLTRPSSTEKLILTKKGYCERKSGAQWKRAGDEWHNENGNNCKQLVGNTRWVDETKTWLVRSLNTEVKLKGWCRDRDGTDVRADVVTDVDTEAKCANKCADTCIAYEWRPSSPKCSTFPGHPGTDGQSSQPPTQGGGHSLGIPSSYCYIKQVSKPTPGTIALPFGTGGNPTSTSTAYQVENKVMGGAQGHGIGFWGGSCTCPDGQLFQVGDNMDLCGSLACVGGVSGTCHRHKGEWSFRKVICSAVLQASSAAAPPTPGARPRPTPIATNNFRQMYKLGNIGEKGCPSGYTAINDHRKHDNVCETASKALLIKWTDVVDNTAGKSKSVCLVSQCADNADSKCAGSKVTGRHGATARWICTAITATVETDNTDDVTDEEEEAEEENEKESLGSSEDKAEEEEIKDQSSEGEDDAVDDDSEDTEDADEDNEEEADKKAELEKPEADKKAELEKLNADKKVELEKLNATDEENKVHEAEKELTAKQPAKAEKKNANGETREQATRLKQLGLVAVVICLGLWFFLSQQSGQGGSNNSSLEDEKKNLQEQREHLEHMRADQLRREALGIMATEPSLEVEVEEEGDHEGEEAAAGDVVATASEVVASSATASDGQPAAATPLAATA